MPSEKSATYLTAAQVRRRYGSRNAVWLYRILQRDPAFPKPIYIAGQRYWLEGALDAYDASEARKIAPPAGPALAREPQEAA